MTSVVEISSFVVVRGVPDVSITLIGRVVFVVVDSDLMINIYRITESN